MKFSKLVATLVGVCVLGFVSFSYALPPQAATTDSLIVLDGTNAEPGSYVFMVVVGEDGTLSIKQIKQIVRFDGSGPIPPTDPKPDPPTNPEPTAFADDVAKWTKQFISYPGWQDDAIRMASAFDKLATEVLQGKWDAKDGITENIAATVLAGEMVRVVEIALGNRRDDWQEVRSRFSDHMKKEFQQGRLTTVPQHGDLCKEFAKGLREAVK